jgi:predicted nuclease of predicted toxin-antitoxin system
MTLLADESVDRSVVVRLRQDGFDVAYIAEAEPGMVDSAVLALANKQNALLLTSDKDFGELVFRQRLGNAGVALFRLGGLSPDAKASVVSESFAKHGAKLMDAFSVISPGSIRIRKRYAVA